MSLTADSVRHIFPKVNPTGFVPFNPRGELTIYTRRLPHWRQKGATYFVTTHLGDSLPQSKLQELELLRAQWKCTRKPGETSFQEKEALAKAIQTKIERWLDTGYGRCALANGEVLQTAEEALLHFDEKQYRLFAYVIMPNHCHLAIKPLGKITLESILQQRKSFIATRARRIFAGTGSFWHEESYDRIIRDSGHLYRVLRYIESNPSKARLSSKQCRLGLRQEWQEWYDALTGGMSQFPRRH